jgi:hypothetical protein
MSSKFDPEILGYAAGLIVVGCGLLFFKAWLLTVILGWFGVTIIGFWKATAIIIGLDLLLYSGSKK